jgi:uncharacterized protein (TIGR03437 family)
LVTESNPARAGQDLVIYATGLGGVTPQVSNGAAAPAELQANVSASVSVQIGGRDAEVSYARLAPGHVGVYEIKVRIPSDTTPAADVAVILTVGGMQSAPVPIIIAP